MHVVARLHPLDDEPRMFERLEREFRLIASIQSEGVLRVLDLQRLDDAIVLIAEAFDGVSLDAYRASQEVTPELFLSIAEQVARTLADVHEAGIIHKDMRPGNVLIDPYRLRVRLKGFALSVSVAWTSPGEEVFWDTVPYVSPEQTGRMQRRVDYRSDLYSLGATLYQLATGQPPFASSDPVEVLHAHLAREPEALDKVRAGFPPMLSRIVLKLLQKDPDDRYQTATAVLRDLHRCREGLDETGAIPEFPLAADEVALHLEPSDALYGRNPELAALQEAYSEVRRVGRAKLVLISGQPGVGKTALVETALDHFAELGARCVRGRIDPYGATTPYDGFRQALAALVDEILTGTDADLATWRERLNQALKPSAQAIVELVPKFGWVVGPQPPLPEVAPEASASRLSDALGRLFAVAALPEEPLVLFLDDLHWADSGTLQLLEVLFRHAPSMTLLVIGAYQHRDVTMDHPLAATVERLWSQDPTARALRVQPLKVADVNRLVAESLDRPEQETEPLTALIARKTDSNPLFVKQFLVYAARIGLLDHTPEAGWTWDLAAIEHADIPDDVAAMMTDKIARLPLRMQRVLKYASIAGMHFDLDTLMALDPARDQLQEHLRGLVEEGLVAQVGEGYRFTHERIREAVHAMLPPVEAARLYRLIGRHRLQQVNPEKLSEHVFEVVDPLNRAVILLQEPEERLQLAELDLMAGRISLESGVPSAARVYFDVALRLLRREDWDSRPRLCLDVHLEAAEAQRRLGETQPAEDLYRSVLARNLPDVHRAEVCALLTSLYVVRGEPERALKVGTMGLRLIGSPLGRRGGLFGVIGQAIAVWWQLERMDEEEWTRLSPASDPVWRVERELAEQMAPATFFVDPMLAARIVLAALRDLPRRGYVAHPAVYFAALAVMVSGALRAYKIAHRLAQRAIRLLEHYPEAAGAAKARQLVHGLVEPFIVPWGRCEDGLEHAFHLATQARDVATAAYVAGHQASLRLLMGDPLQEVEEFTKRAALYARDVGLEDIAWSIEAVGDASFVLRGMPSDTDVVQALALDRLEDRVGWARSDGYTAATLVLCVQGRFEEAWSLVEASRVAPKGGMAFPTLLGMEFEVLRGLAACAAAGSPRGLTRRQARRTVRRARKLLRPLVKISPLSFAPRGLLLEAEEHRLMGRIRDAHDAYARARVVAGPAGHLALRGIILERAASLASEQGWDVEAEAYLGHARAVFKAWGADAKVTDLDRRGGTILHRRELIGRDMAWTDSAPPTRAPLLHPRTTLDLATILDTARTLSEEVQLEVVIDQVLHLALANAGANRAVLLLADEGTLHLEAEVDADGRFQHVRPTLRLEDAPSRLSVAVVRLVARTVETVVVEDAAEEERFAADPYLASHAVRSVLCVPVLKRTKLVGVLYLENTLVARAFTEERQEILRLIATQAAISLENARLVEALRTARDDLEQRVNERTRELMAVQDHLVDAARRAGMAEVATGVLHNIGNILNSVNTGTADIEETLRRSRLPSLERTVSLIAEHTDDLPEFLVNDERGRLVPEFLRLVVHQLTTERERVRNQVEQLGANVEHMRQVISAQQAYADVGGVVDEIEVDALVEEAIRICGASRPWRDHLLVRHFDDLPILVIDRHKVLQILVNLIGNARDALDDAGASGDRRIVVSIRQLSERVEVSVRDFGVGIPQENLERIFHHGFTTKRNGHGFGLHSSAIAAQQLGGSIRVESEGLGRGATFTLDVPRRPLARVGAG